MKIAYCITRMDEIGGAQIHLRDIALYYKAQGHDVCILTGSLGNLTQALADKGVEIIHVSSMRRSIHPLYDAVALFEMVRILRSLKPDILACHSSKAGLLGRVAARLAGIKSVFTVHGWAFTEGVPERTAKVYRVLEKLCGYITTHIITVSQYDKNLALKYNVVPDALMSVVHNGVPDIDYKDRVPLEKNTPIKLVMIARFSAPKDQALLLRALSRCLDMNWSLDLVGGGDSAACVKYCQENNLADRVNFLGERRDVVEILKNSDVLCLISNWEAFPMCILEAMRAGMPVISSDVGGVKESVTHGKTGYLVKRADVNALEETIRLMLSDTVKLIDMGRNARKSYEESFSFRAMVEKTFSVYQKI